ncbi:PREDICTED: zinc finger, partial [Prunus dulcis]
RAFSTMKHVKTVLRNKMEDEYLVDSLIVYIEKELFVNIDSDSIINDFDSL